MTCMNDPFTGEVFESLMSSPAVGDILFMGYTTHDNPDDVPLGENGLTKLYCRVLGAADTNSVKAMHSRLPKRYRKPLSTFKWWRVLYD